MLFVCDRNRNISCTLGSDPPVEPMLLSLAYLSIQHLYKKVYRRCPGTNSYTAGSIISSCYLSDRDRSIMSQEEWTKMIYRSILSLSSLFTYFSIQPFHAKINRECKTNSHTAAILCFVTTRTADFLVLSSRYCLVDREIYRVDSPAVLKVKET